MATSIPRSAPGPNLEAATAGARAESKVQPQPRVAAGPWRRAGWRLGRDRVAKAAALVLGALVAVAVVVPLVITIDPYQQSLSASLLPPGQDGHPLGTDHLGRDVLLRLVDGARVSLSMGFIAVAISVVLGSSIGLLSGYFGKHLDSVLMRLMDVKLAFPGILAALVIVTVLGAGLEKAMIAVGIGAVPRYARVVRGSVLATKHELFVESARSLGASDARIMLTHIVPQVLGPVITLATLGLATAILAAASLSFLGLGAQPPTAEWGLMLADGRKYLRVAWWLAIFPGLAIMITVVAINLLGDGVRDALDPKISTGGD
jgi:peptide/nickel transport system permease protein